MKSYSNMLLITALLSSVSVNAAEKLQKGFSPSGMVKRSANASIRYADKYLKALFVLWVSTEVVKRTPLNKLVDMVDNVQLLKNVEASIPGAADLHMVRNMTTVAVGTLGIGLADAVRTQTNIDNTLRKHCPKIAEILDKAMDFLGLVD